MNIKYSLSLKVNIIFGGKSFGQSQNLELAKVENSTKRGANVKSLTKIEEASIFKEGIYHMEASC